MSARTRNILLQHAVFSLRVIPTLATPLTWRYPDQVWEQLRNAPSIRLTLKGAVVPRFA